ncbi:MAG: ZIP family metal transporter [Burkholderiaceae bacterium]|nr:ZIP family metal transporter [Burkholderiaceae bacterium]
MVLIATIAATLVAGIGSVWLAALLLRAGRGAGQGGAGPQNLLSLAAGGLLATAFMHLLPEAFESQADAHALFATLLVGVVFFFLLDKAELWHHGHEHGLAHAQGQPQAHGHGHGHGHGHEHEHEHDHTHDPAHAQAHEAGHGGRAAGGWAVLTGDSVHCFGDGMLIASAFVADLRLGVIAALSVLAHEVPHHMGDLVVLGQSSASRSVALLKVSLAGAVTALGGVVGYFLVDRLQDGLPYFLAVASSSFIYVALADLIPQLQKHLTLRQTAGQVFWLLAGMALVTLVSAGVHVH